MKTKILIAAFICSILCNMAKAQDHGVLAQNAYTKAEEYFSQGDYNRALSQLNAAEQYLGQTNSKILYLKINILNAQFSKSSTYYPILKSTISRFFDITNKNTYPTDKYIEIVRLQSDIEDFIKTDSTAGNRLLSNGDLSSIQSYLAAHPNTFYSSKLNNKRTELQKIQDEIDAKLAIDNRLKELTDEISRAKGKSFNRRFWGGFAFVAGGAIAIGGIKQELVTGDNAGVAVLNPILGGLGGAACVFGAIGLIGGNHREVKQLKKEQSELMQRKKALALYLSPYYQKIFAYNAFGINLNVSF
jgi:hypothetical protein